MAAKSEKKPKINEVIDRLAEVTKSLVEEGVEPSQVVFALTSVAADIALRRAMRFSHRHSSNGEAERERSSASHDVSALRAAFRRCHSDSEFRARFIANCLKSIRLPRGPSQRPQLDQVPPPIASPVDSGWRRNRRPHPATASEESCHRRGHHFLSLNDPKRPFGQVRGCKHRHYSF
jgi:hypothetical protein